MAFNFQKILCPIQFNDSNSTIALDLARHLALESKGRIFLLHVTPSKLVVPDLPGYRDLFPKDEQAVSEQLDKLAAPYLDKNSYQIILRTGDPAEMINLVARELGIDLIIIPTHGRRGLSHFVMGSAAERVIREASCMVLTIRPELIRKSSV